jgi:hypothetical protein
VQHYIAYASDDQLRKLRRHIRRQIEGQHRAKVRVRGGENSAQYGHNQALVTQLQDLLCGGGGSPRAAATHADAGAMKVVADRAPMNAQPRSDLAQGPAFRIQLRRTSTSMALP